MEPEPRAPRATAPPRRAGPGTLSPPPSPGGGRRALGTCGAGARHGSHRFNRFQILVVSSDLWSKDRGGTSARLEARPWLGLGAGCGGAGRGALTPGLRCKRVPPHAAAEPAPADPSRPIPSRARERGPGQTRPGQSHDRTEASSEVCTKQRRRPGSNTADGPPGFHRWAPAGRARDTARAALTGQRQQQATRPAPTSQRPLSPWFKAIFQETSFKSSDGPPGAPGHRPTEAGRAGDIEPPAVPRRRAAGSGHPWGGREARLAPL